MSDQEPDARERLEQAGFLADDPAATPTQRFEASDADRQYANEDLLELLDRVDMDIRPWIPEPGDKIAGTLVDITEAGKDSEFDPYKQLVIKTPSGQYASVACFHTILKNAIEGRLNAGTLKPGDDIAILYVGLGIKTGPRSAPHIYRVAVHQILR